MKNKKRIFRKIAFIVLIVTTIGLLIPQNLIIPVENASKNDWNSETFWYYPWGKSVTHKGVDIFAKEGTHILSATNGITLYTGKLGMGGNVVMILGPKWRIHYYAHLKDINVNSFHYVRRGKLIATVGTSGNATGKPAHLHYSIVTLIPYPWRIDSDKQGWKKMFYLNPLDYF